MRTTALAVVLGLCLALGCSNDKGITKPTELEKPALSSQFTAIQEGFVYIEGAGPCLSVKGGATGSPTVTITCVNDGATILRVRTIQGDVLSVRSDGTVHITGKLFLNGKPIE